VLIIRDEDIHHAADVLGGTFNEHDLSFLRHAGSCDVHACPGSGKTTLLVAKLCAIARGWPWRDRGMLVLSHTNVARKEVERRLSEDPASTRLLSYPHFIGTIQGFVDRFLAIPYLRDIGINGARVGDPRVDDDHFAAKAWSWFNRSEKYKTARAYLRRKRNQGRELVETLAYKGSDRELTAGESGIPGDSSPTGIQLRKLKDELSEYGYFRYQDMYALAEAAVEAHPYLAPALQTRFPVVFVDEMQDTAPEQDAVIQRVFAARCVVQRLGDNNQGIFRSSAAQVGCFNLVSPLELPLSRRLAPMIAKFATGLTAAHPLALVGNSKRQDRRHTVFVFANDTMVNVLPRYGALVLSEWGDGLPENFVAKAVGFRNPAEAQMENLPRTIGDYWPALRGPSADATETSANFVDVVRQARRLLLQTAEGKAAYDLVLDGVARFIELHEQSRATRGAVKERLKTGRIEAASFRAFAKEALLGGKVSSEWWERAKPLLRDSVVPGATATKREAKAYLEWSEGAASECESAPSNVYVHSDGSRRVAIEVGTIHSVKGETHDATLVLETHYYTHDIGSLLPYLAAGTPPSGLGSRIADHMKRVFVGLTRAKELACVAVHRDRFDDDAEKKLRDAGWAVELV
jgi:DNA helicase II / ATP-dependent DNA helicase PcrA